MTSDRVEASDVTPLKLSARERQLLHQLQIAIEQLYRLDESPPIVDFLVEGSDVCEELLVCEDDDLFIALAIDPKLLSSLSQLALNRHNLQAFAMVVEGVSHFLLLNHRARQQQRTYRRSS